MAITCPFVDCILDVSFDKAQFAGMDNVIEEICDVLVHLTNEKVIV